MRIERLQVDGFGHFAQMDIGPFDRRITVIAGANEAGKTTLLAFVRTVLFGFPVQHRDSHYPPLAGGKHGGRVLLVADDGKRYTVERHVGARGGPVTVSGADGSRLDGAGLPDLLGHASLELFQSVFAFGLTELQDIASLKGNEVSGRIYSAGLGAANLPKALKDLEGVRDAIFTPRGRTRDSVAGVLAELQAVDSSLAQTLAHAAEYARLTATRAELYTKLDTLHGRQAALRSRERELERLGKGWVEWDTLQETELRLAELPPFERFPENATVRMDHLQRAIGDAGEALREATEELQRLQAASGVGVEDEALLEQADAIKQMGQGLKAIGMSVRDLPEREAELRNLEETLRDSLRALGPGWDELRLETFDTSIAARDEVDQWGRKLSEGEKAIELDRRRDELRDAVETEGRARQLVETTAEPALDAPTLEARRNALRGVRTSLDALARARDRRRDLEARLEQAAQESAEAGAGLSPLMIPLLAVLGGLSAVVAGLALGRQEVAVAAGALLLLAGAVALGLSMAARRSTAPRPAPGGGALPRLADEARRDEVGAEESLKEVAGPLGAEVTDALDIDRLDAELDAAMAALETWRAAVQRLHDAAMERERCERRVEEAEAKDKEALKRRDSLKAEWAAWLRDRRLAEGLTPAGVAQVTARVETARAERGRVLDMRGRVGAIKKDIEEYRDLVAPVAAGHVPGWSGGDASRLAATADALIARLESARRGVGKRTNAEEAAEKAGSEVERQRGRVERLETELAELLAAAGASDPEDLRTRDSQHALRGQLEEKRRGHRTRLQQLCRPDEPLKSLVEALRRTTPEAISDEVERVQSELQGADAEAIAVGEKLGLVQTSLKALTGEEESSALRGRREVLLEKLRDLAREWSKQTIAQDILQRARQKYERERQPGVMRHAEVFFGTITGQRYSHLFSPLGEQAITVAGEDRAAKRPEQLSRGTREQLYLALRFGLIREFGERTERLPVVVDEVLVNFDPRRARRAAEAFVEMSETNQVLVFTCHPETVQLFRAAWPGAQVIDLDAALAHDTQGRLV